MQDRLLAWPFQWPSAREFFGVDRRTDRWLKHAGRRVFISRVISPWGRRWADVETPLGRFAAQRARRGRYAAALAGRHPYQDIDLPEGTTAQALAAVIAERTVAVEAAAGDAAAEGNVEGGLVAAATEGVIRLRDALDEVGPPQPEPLVFPSVSPRAPAFARLASVRRLGASIFGQ
ncbi:MAG: hypothetical protein K6T37_07825 [Acidothermus cellulolyticus]|nr:hypothetical protein [Acidothermus cellulolyticus]